MFLGQLSICLLQILILSLFGLLLELIFNFFHIFRVFATVKINHIFIVKFLQSSRHQLLTNFRFLNRQLILCFYCKQSVLQKFYTCIVTQCIYCVLFLIEKKSNSSRINN